MQGAEMSELNLKETLEQLKTLNSQGGVDLTQQIADLEREISASNQSESETQPQEEQVLEPDDLARVKLARHPKRPHSLDYIERMFEGFYELHGDRLFGDDGAMVTGLAHLDGQPVAIVAQQKGRDLEENQLRNYGLPHPEGYRKAQRIMKLAERFDFPVITLVDSGGAFPGKASEERNIGGALAESIYTMTSLKVPIIVAIIGEGNSGGAIGIGVGDRTIIMENAYYSVITPEGCAAILWRDRAKAPDVARALRLTAPHLIDLGIVDSIVPEPEGGAHKDSDAAAKSLKSAIKRSLKELSKLDSETLWERRFDRWQSHGVYEELQQDVEAEV
jgi:acetyl-CoA carboxylase carboxyl transferase subunit alpha